VAAVYTPKDYSFEQIMEDLVGLAERQRRDQSQGRGQRQRDGATP
jgi:hypothetical protein